jgi:hypothetical protein
MMVGYSATLPLRQAVMATCAAIMGALPNMAMELAGRGGSRVMFAVGLRLPPLTRSSLPGR